MIILCQNCGNRKNKFREKCLNCGFKPKSKDEEAESLVLSDFWYKQNGMNGKDAKEKMLALEKSLKSKEYIKNPSDIAAAKVYLEKIAKESNLAVFRTLKFITPLLIIILLAVVIFVLKNCF